jgi:hypothetical protein
MKIAYIDRKFSDDRMTTIETANEIIEDYANQGYILTLRQLYYQFVARGLIENSERSYKNLGGLVADGRMAGYIDWDGIEDRGRGVKPWLIEEASRRSSTRSSATSRWTSGLGRTPTSRCGSRRKRWRPSSSAHVAAGPCRTCRARATSRSPKRGALASGSRRCWTKVATAC